MLKQKKQKNDLELQIRLYDIGRKPEKLKPSVLALEIDYTILKNLSAIEKEKLISQSLKDIYTLEYQVSLKKMIWSVKLNIYRIFILLTKLSKTSQAELISKEKDLTKFWLTFCPEMSKKLWLPIKTGCVGSRGTTLSGFLNKKELISSSKIKKNIAQSQNLAMTCSVSSMYSPHDTTAYEGNILLKEKKAKRLKTLRLYETRTHNRLVKKDPDRIKKEIIDIDDYIIKAKKIKVIPFSKDSRKTLNDAFAVCRKLRNCFTDEINKNPNITMYEMRDKFVTESKMKEKELKQLGWTFRISQKIREATVRRYMIDYATANKNLKDSTYKFYYKVKKNKNGKKKKRKIKKKITMRFKEKDEKKQTIYVSKERSMFVDDGNMLETFNGIKLILTEKYGEGIPQCDLVLQRIGYDYYLYIPEYSEPDFRTEAPDRIVALDLGLKTFATYFSPDGEWGEIYPKFQDKLKKAYLRIEKIKKKTTLPKMRKKKAIQKIERGIKNTVDDLQWKAARWLLSNFRKIIVSRLYVAKANKLVKKIQADAELCSFVDKLKLKSMEYKNSEIHICREHNTTKACTNCLSLNTTRNNEVICKTCGFRSHRDFSAARNIFMKHCF